MPTFPHYSQLDAMDCGATCLRMIAKYYGKSYSNQFLREKSFITREGVSMLGIADAAESIGFRTMGVKIPLEKLLETPLPCILHWNQNHFVVLYKAPKPPQGAFRKSPKGGFRGLFHISDPAGSKYALDTEGFIKCWASSEQNGEKVGAALLLEPTPAFYSTPSPEGEGAGGEVKGISFFFKYLKPFKSQLAQLFLGLIIGSILSLIFPFLTQSIVDKGIANNNLSFVTLVLIAQLVLFCTQTAVGFLQSWVSLHINTRISISLISDFLSKLMRLPLRFFDSKNVGDIMQRIGDNERIKSFLTGSSITTLFSFFNFIIFAFILAYYNLTLLAVFLCGNILYIAWVMLFLRYRRRLDMARFSQAAAEQSNLVQIVTGMQEIKLNNCEKQQRWKWERIQVKLFNISIKGLALGQYQQLGSVFFTQITSLVISYLSARSVIEGNMTLGMMMSVSYIIGQLSAPISQVIGFVQAAQDAKISLERLNEIHNKEDESPQASPNPSTRGELFLPFREGMSRVTNNVQSDYVVAGGFSPLHNGEGLGVRFKDVYFSYDGAERNYALNGVSLEIPAHKITAIVGASGSGKTTLIKLLLGFYQPNKGEIYLQATSNSPKEGGMSRITNDVQSDNVVADEFSPLPKERGQGVRLQDINPHFWRSRCGAVMQDGFIFSDTIAANIAVGEENIDKARLLYAVETANIKDFIEELPLRYNTKIGMEGNGISQGQRQRLLIARAVYKNPDFLFFDEATNALDANNEKVIMDNLSEFYRGKTVVVVAHRLSTVKNADKIIVLEKGKIVEEGTHTELTNLKGRYYELVKNQLELGN